MLEDLEFLERFLDQIFSACPSLHISIKNQAGDFQRGFFSQASGAVQPVPDLGVDCASPGAEGLYKHEIRWQAFAYAGRLQQKSVVL